MGWHYNRFIDMKIGLGVGTGYRRGMLLGAPVGPYLPLPAPDNTGNFVPTNQRNDLSNWSRTRIPAPTIIDYPYYDPNKSSNFLHTINEIDPYILLSVPVGEAIASKTYVFSFDIIYIQMATSIALQSFMYGATGGMELEFKSHTVSGSGNTWQRFTQTKTFTSNALGTSVVIRIDPDPATVINDNYRICNISLKKV